MTIRKSVLFGGVGLVLVGLASAGFAQEAAKVLEQRQALMKAVGGNMKALGEIAKGERTETPQEVGRRAREINANAKQIAMMFKPEFHTANVTGDLKTTASEKIWKEPAQFSDSSSKLELASAQLATAADAGDQEKMKAAIGELAKTCGGCHELYRVKK